MHSDQLHIAASRETFKFAIHLKTAAVMGFIAGLYKLKGQ